jgi:hypothetical protein
MQQAARSALAENDMEVFSQRGMVKPKTRVRRRYSRETTERFAQLRSCSTR